MDYLYLFLGIVVILTCFYFVISPFFHPGGATTADEAVKEPLEDLYRFLMNDLEMDLLMKKVTTEDYAALKRNYDLLAAQVMKESGHVHQQSGQKETPIQVDEEIWRELEKMRQSARKKGEG